MVTLRAARPDDITALAPLCGQLGYPAPHGQLPPSLAALLARPDAHLVLVAENEHGLCGWLHGYIRSLQASDPALEIGGLVVAEAVRGQGIGNRLLAETESRAWQQGDRQLTLRSQEHRSDAHRFNQRQGHHVAKRQLCLRKRLAPAASAAW